MKWKLWKSEEDLTEEPERLLKEVKQRGKKIDDLSRRLENRREMNRFTDGLVATFRRYDATNHQ